MSFSEAASLTEALLVAKGGAAPSRLTMPRTGGVSAGRARHPDGRARLALRLDEERHRRLRLATAHLRKSGQGLLLAALDHYLDHVVPTLVDRNCHCLSCGAVPGPSAPRAELR